MNSTTSPRDNMNRAKDAAGSVMERGKEALGHVGEAAGNVAATVGQKAENVTAAAGRGMQHLADTVRDKGPESGVLGKATGKVADALACGGEYLEEKRLSGMADDMAGLIKRNPIPAMLAGIGLGFLLARLIRS